MATLLFALASAAETDLPRLELGEPEVMMNHLDWGIRWSPDGHISVLRRPGGIVLFHDQYRWSGASLDEAAPDPQDAEGNAARVIARPEDWVGFYSNSAWILAVYDDTPNNRLLALLHCEDKEVEGATDGRGQPVYKSIALAESRDDGLSWEIRDQVITSTVPKEGYSAQDYDNAIGGAGDFCAFFHPDGHVYVYYAGDGTREEPDWGLKLARCRISDLDRTDGWRKFRDGRWDENGLGGRASPLLGDADEIPIFASVHYNTHLERYVLVYLDIGEPYKRFYVRFSADAVRWSPRQLILQAGEDDIAYPSIIADPGADETRNETYLDQRAGEGAWLYYAHWPNGFKDNRRNMVRRWVTFHRGGP